MTERDIDDVAGTYEEQMLDYAQRQTKALETGLLVLEVAVFLAALAAVIWLIAVLGS